MYKNILVTATNSPYYDSLLTLISGIHEHSVNIVDKIFVYNLGLDTNEIKTLNSLKNVEVLESALPLQNKNLYLYSIKILSVVIDRCVSFML